MRTPVIVRTPIVADEPATETPIADALASAVRRIVQPVHPLDDEGWRLCARPGCGAEFKPKTTYKSVDGTVKSTEVFCSSTCASINYHATRDGRAPVLLREQVVDVVPVPERPERTIEGAVRAHAERVRARVAVPIAQTALTDEAPATQPTRRAVPASDNTDDPVQVRKYGPLRTVGDIVRETEFGKRVRFVECRHEGSVAKKARRGRCRLCRNAALGVTPKRGRPKRERPLRTPVKARKPRAKTIVRKKKGKGR